MLRDGDLVELHFTGTLDDGAVFDTSRGRRARVFVIGRGQLLVAFESAIRPLSAGERASFRLERPEAYGPRDPALVYRVQRGDGADDPQPGDMVELTGGVPGRVVAVEGETVTVDANHPLAGQTLNFEVEIVSVRRAAG
jgi:FKBP-type peptidyl-prolyl cis-trans isomerase 2